jgi:WD40 repeat protein
MIDPDLSADGRHVFVGNWRGTEFQGSLIDLEAKRTVRSFEGDHVVGTFHPSGKTLAVCTRGATEFWDVATDRRLQRLERAPGQLAIQVAFSPDGHLAAWARSNYEVQLIDASSRAVILRIPNPELRMVSRLSFSADGERLMITSASAVTQIWELGAIRKELAAMKLDW